MDGRFLSKQEVIRASRNFVCVRMMTYESAQEAEVLKTLWRQGQPLENTVFAILDPRGRTILNGGRSPMRLFRDSYEMANSMNQIAAHYNRGKLEADEIPSVDTVRLGIDVAACDKRPLAVVVGRSSAETQYLSRKLAPLAWSDELIGKLVYTTSQGDDLRAISGAQVTSGYLFVLPNSFGTQGHVVYQLNGSATQADLQRAARFAISSNHPQTVSHREHVMAGRQRGITWETAIPVTDPHSPNRGSGGRYGANRSRSWGY